VTRVAPVKPKDTGGVERDVDVLLLDNRDSFTWNLAHGFMELGARVVVEDADAVTAASILGASAGERPRLVCIGPGPRGPADLPHLLDIVRGLDGHVPIFGVCLGLQALVRAHGGEVGHARAPVHGKRDAIVIGADDATGRDVDGAHDTRDDVGVLRGLPSPLWVMRYHSLVATRVPARFTVTARDRHGQVMALRDARARIEAVQFHPESIGTAGGLTILARALALGGIPARALDGRPGSVPPMRDVGPSFSEARYVAARPEEGSDPWTIHPD
jgi:anthranilate synthase/aminodeoxychorismate synthase-like glutamine amidotransferase